jgi:hypothetical protein
VTALGLFGFASTGLGSAVVGETRRITLEQKATTGVDAMKAQYRRARIDPVSQGKSLHAAEDVARQEALFRYAYLGDLGAVLRELS